MTENEDMRSLVYQLFLVDQQYRGLEKRLAGSRKNLKNQSTKLNKLKEEFTSTDEQRKRLQAMVDMLENDAASMDERVNKLREQMNTVSTNKEYSALLVEVNTLKADKGKVEEKALRNMTELDNLRSRCDQLSEAITGQEKLVSHAEQTLEASTDEVREQLDSVKAKRDEAAQKVEPETLKLFEELGLSYEGDAVASIEIEDRARMEFLCNACYSMQPLEVINRLMTTNDIICCPSCRRILTMPTAVHQEIKGS